MYTSTALYEWLKELRIWRVVFVTLPIILGGIASAKILVNEPSMNWLIAICALLAGLFPAIYKALDLDVSVKTMSDSAHRFKVLQDRFRQTATISAQGSTEQLEEDFKQLMDRMDDARSANPAIPNRYIKKAQAKIKSGDYSFTVDTLG